jgi:hypothetical protein
LLPATAVVVVLAAGASFRPAPEQRAPRFAGEGEKLQARPLPRPTTVRRPHVARRPSLALGLPWHGHLVRGVRLPREGRTFFTWDPVRKRSPNAGWRRYGTDRLVHAVLAVVTAYAQAHPHAPRVGIGDLSRTHGGDFGPRFGGVGHASHQNGLDVDVYYPRRDRRERPPVAPSQIDRALAQDLVDRFVHAGAELVFVGPHTGLHGPRGVVGVLPAYHDNHMHVRLPRRPLVRGHMLGRSQRGRPIRAVEVGDSRSTHSALVVGCIHGNECAGIAVVRRLTRLARRASLDLWLVADLNPDGYALGVRQNGRGVDLNRNFPVHWRARGRPWDPEYPGPRPLSEREARIAVRLIERVRPDVTIWFHQPQAVVRISGRSAPVARRYARLAGLPFRALGSPPGAATAWQHRRFPCDAAFVVELPPGRLSARTAARHARAALRVSALASARC